MATVDNYLPCSDETDTTYEGLSIDVWRRVAETINRPYTMTTVSTFSRAVDAAADSRVDLVTSCHKITPGRLERVEFSVPYTRDSLGMLSRRSHGLNFSVAQRLLGEPSIRILFLSVLVGTTATLIFETHKPLNASKLTASQLKTVLAEGVAVNAGTKMHDWLLLQIDRHNLGPTKRGAVLAVEQQGALEDALRSGVVRHIVSDVSVLNQMLQNLEDSDAYRLSLKMPNKTPQAFIFGASLSPELKQAINIALAEMNYGGDSARLERSWQKSVR